MNCIRCQEQPATITCDCLTFERQSSDVGYDISSGTKTVRVHEYSNGVSEAGLCEKCAKTIAFWEPKVLFPRLYTRFYLIWGALELICFAVLCIGGCSQKKGDESNNIWIIVCLSVMFAMLAAALVFELILRIRGARKRTERDKLLIGCAKSHPYKKTRIRKSYVPLGQGLYKDYTAFRKVNSDIMEENAKKVYERIVAPGSKVTFSDELKSSL